MLTSKFEYGILKIYKNEQQIVEQPFNPNNHTSWSNEKEATDWFVAEMINIVATPDEKEEFIKALNLGE